MSAPIGPGDWVECVDTSGTDSPLVLGALYRVLEVAPSTHPLYCDEMAVWVFPRGFRHNGKIYGGNYPRRFRPVYRPKSEIIEALKAPPVRKRERVQA